MEQAPEQVDDLLELTDTDCVDVNILDMACGIGRHTIEFAKHGHTVTAVDATRPFLQAAERYAEDAGVEVEYIHGDMREFKHEKAFDLVVNLNTSFGYFENREDDERTVQNFYNSLRPGGTLVIELAGKELVAQDYQPKTWVENDGRYVLEYRDVAEDWSWMNNKLIIASESGIEEFDVSHRLYSAAELKTLLESAGFDHVNIYGDFDGIPYDENANRLVVVADK